MSKARSERKHKALPEQSRRRLDQLVRKLDGAKIGNVGFNKCVVMDRSKARVWITAYALDNRHDEFDEQLSFQPHELLHFCQEVLRIANSGVLLPPQSGGKEQPVVGIPNNRTDG